MTLSVFVFDEVKTQDVVAHFQMESYVITVRQTIHSYRYEEIAAKEAAETPIDNNSPPHVETLGISIQEVVQTKEALS